LRGQPVSGCNDERVFALDATTVVDDGALGQFILPHEAVRQSPDPDALLLGFLQETYEAAAERSRRDREALERVA
jgi:Family of unknown function (DUF5996)